ncbi:MAG TPA: hypothetical protein VF843_17055 [Streptosporangiaceae bacterium]
MPYPRTRTRATAALDAGGAIPGGGTGARRAPADIAFGRHGRRRAGPPRAVKLVIVTGIAAAGLCLVTGLTAVVVRIGARPASGPPIGLPAAIGRAGGRTGDGAAARARPHLPRSGRPLTSAARTLRTYQGAGRARRGPFLIARPGTWGLSWAYRCGQDHAGQFAVTGQSRTAGTDVAVAASGPSGHGFTSASDPGPHTLTMITRCSWRITVVVPAGRRQR